jgi:DNA replication protein DnaD
MLTCEICTKKYTTKKALLFHQAEVHINELERTCCHCNKTLTSRSAKKRHESDCPSQRKQLWIPQSEIITNQSPEQRHVHVPAPLSSQSSKIISYYCEWMEEGGYSPILVTQKRRLTATSISTYGLHLRSFFSFIENGKTSGNSTIDLVHLSSQTKIIREFLSYLEACKYTNKTISNKIFAIERLIGFYYEKMNELESNQLTKMKINTAQQKRLSETLEFLRQEAKIVAPAAKRETIARNCRDSLIKENKWEDLHTILTKFFKFEESILQLMNTIPTYSDLVILEKRPLLSDVLKIQNYILLHLVIFRPTMRSQNFILEILKVPQTPKNADRNGIFICPDSDNVMIQYCKYKTAQLYGFLQFYLSDKHALLIRKFVAIRPWLFPSPSQPRHNFLFSDNKCNPLQRVGRAFKSFAQPLFEKNLGISTIRKIMESEIFESNG